MAKRMEGGGGAKSAWVPVGKAIGRWSLDSSLVGYGYEKTGETLFLFTETHTTP